MVLSYLTPARKGNQMYKARTFATFSLRLKNRRLVLIKQNLSNKVEKVILIDHLISTPAGRCLKIIDLEALKIGSLRKTILIDNDSFKMVQAALLVKKNQCLFVIFLAHTSVRQGQEIVGQ